VSIDLGLPYNIMFRVAEKLRMNLYLEASSVKLQSVVVYVTAG